MSLFQNKPKPQNNSPSSKPKSIFGKHSLGALRSDIRKEFTKMSDPTTIGHTMKQWQKYHLVDDLFPSGLGDHISQKEVDMKIQELSRLKFTVKDPSEKAEFQDKIDFLKKLKGL